MADGRHVRKCWKCYNSLTNRPTLTKLGWSHPIMSPICPPWCSCHGNGRCLATAHWIVCSYGRLEAERVNQFLLKFGKQQQIRTTMTVTWSNIKIFKIQNGGQSLLENIRNAITSLPMDRLGRNLGGRIPSCSQYCKCYNSSYDWDDSWVVASKQHFSAKSFPWYWSLLLTAQ